MNVITSVFGNKRSLRRGLIVNVIIALLLCLLIAGIILVKEFYEHLEENLDAALLNEATEVIGQIDPDAAFYGLNPDALRFQGVNGAYRYTVFDGSGAVVVGGETSEAIQAQIVTIALGQPMRISLPGVRVGIGLKAKVKERDVYVLVSTYPQGEDATAIQEIIHEIEEELGWVVLGVIIVLASALLATQRALIPIQNLSDQAERIGPAAANQRLKTDQVPTEIAPLIKSVNAAFDRLEDGYQAQRDFASNVAHEIRTPIAVLRSSVERISDPTIKATLEQDVLRLDQMFGQLINLARADAAIKSSFSEVDLHDIAVDVASDAVQAALGQGRSLSVTGTAQATVKGHSGLLTVALSNLVSNALAYAPVGSEIEIEVLANPAGFRVLDRGPGVPDDLKPLLFERFNRGAQTNTNSTGSGIGLAIVKSVAKSHGAVVDIADREGGGSAFSFSFDG
ncbi:ATP-binding protein [Litoreibacter janthinus]|uniref:histidine kinase n=1 Tax=Litoreibacter janthinus TaxID=670154 RepID=A0A1I6H2N6_9RHOB|nr:ATP-binding protein [Litoreibacter janthinus]SFR48680.1 Signal transduction histidine kinase [Litoreibacter janthinus]